MPSNIGDKFIQDISKTDEIVTLKIQNEIYKYPFVWLRDNCRCVDCFHTTAKSRIIDWRKFDLNIQPKLFEETSNSIKITWDDGHQSEYTFDWLKFRSFLKKDKLIYKENFYKPKKITWNGDTFPDIFSKHDFSTVVSTDKGLHDWLLNLAIYGVALIENAPDREDATDDIIAKIGFTRKTHYGEKFIVQHVPNTVNVAYLNSNLQMHTDLPFYEYCAGVNMLHCLVQTVSQGGDNVLTDCHYVAEYLKEHHPKEYHLLTNLEVEWSDIGVENGIEFYKLYRSPVICLDRHGQVERISFSVPQRGSHFIGDIEDVKPWYEAYTLFLELAHKFGAKFKSKAGQILVFDNIRLLHCRNGYDDADNNVRKIIGAYFDWDEVWSKLRCVKVRLEGIEPTN